MVRLRSGNIATGSPTHQHASRSALIHGLVADNFNVGDLDWSSGRYAVSRIEKVA